MTRVSAVRSPAPHRRSHRSGFATAVAFVAGPLSALAPALPEDAIFTDGFESAECAAWSATSNPTAAPDLDTDDYGDETAPTAVCQLPAGFVFDATDCDDGDDLVFPGSTEICNALDDDCDGTVDDGLRDTNPGCATQVNLGNVNGDAAGAAPQTSSYFEKWFTFTLVETSGSTIDLRARVDLTVPPGADFDLYVICASCGGTTIGSSTNAGSASESVEVRVPDGIGSSSGVFVVEVRHAAGAGCSLWTLTVTGNVGTTTSACP